MRVLITGASSGIGLAIAKVFAEAGHELILHYNQSKKEIETLKRELEEKYQKDILLVKADLSKKEEVFAMINQIKEECHFVDVLINNAGIAIDTLLEDKTWENFEETFRVNVIAPFFLARELGTIMYQRKKGCIINISSTNGMNTYYPMSTDYDASKAALISVTHNLAVSFAPYVRVNSIAPGWVNTRMNQELDQEFIEKENQKIFLHTFGEPEQIAKVALFLASEDASYINNEVIRVDGGSY